MMGFFQALQCYGNILSLSLSSSPWSSACRQATMASRSNFEATFRLS